MWGSACPVAYQAPPLRRPPLPAPGSQLPTAPQLWAGHSEVPSTPGQTAGLFNPSFTVLCGHSSCRELIAAAILSCPWMQLPQTRFPQTQFPQTQLPPRLSAPSPQRSPSPGTARSTYPTDTSFYTVTSRGFCAAQHPLQKELLCGKQAFVFKPEVQESVVVNVRGCLSGSSAAMIVETSKDGHGSCMHSLLTLAVNPE